MHILTFFIEDNIHNYSIESEEDQMTATGKEGKEKKKRNRPDWLDEHTFKSMTEAHQYLVDLKFARRAKTVRTDGSGLTKYRCTYAKSRAKNKCVSGRRIYEPSHLNDIFTIQNNGLDHNHESLDDDDISYHISHELIELIIECSANRMPAKKIIDHISHLREKYELFAEDKIPTIQQIYYAVRKHKQQQAQAIISIGELVEWCEKNSAIPNDEDQAFVLHFETNKEGENMYFRFAVSTLRMVSNCNGLDQVCVDATYKLVWQGFPFLVVGHVDREKKFHPLCFACTSHEKKEDFEFVFEALKASVKTIGGVFEPKILIADAALSIRNAFSTSFPAFLVMIMCYAHVVRNCAKRPLNDKKNRDKILKDMHIMNLSTSIQNFHTSAKLFLEKWQQFEPEFAKYFEEQWLGDHCNWYEAAAVYSPSTNNNLEGNE